MRKLINTILASIIILSAGTLVNAQERVMSEVPKINVKDHESLQRGMGLFVNYCSGCHSAEAQRYNRTARDIGFPEEMLSDVILTGSYSTREGEFIPSKVGDLMYSAMHRKDGEYWLGVAPPDLSTIVRAKGAEYVFQYLRSFYIDPTRPVGVNNIAFENAGMPHVLLELQGEYEPIIEEVLPKGCAVADDDKCVAQKKVVGTRAIEGKEGLYNEGEYRTAVNDIVNFLSYVSEPAQIDRAKYGPWVIGFLIIFTLFAYALNREYWRDVK